MADKPWFNNSFLDRRNSTVQTYPPKDKKVFWADGFLEAEHFGNSVFQPLADGLTLGNNPCDGRVLQPAQQVTWPTGGNKPSEGEVKEYQAEVTGAVGEVTFSMDPFWDVVNEEGDKATIDPSTGLITIDSGGCQGAWPPWIIYWV
ncbi:hypothetical protein KAR91_44350, partial [Candidatus Pacearchaeota archaeon]|nr:hypothetical protein [Candidatus Pacearchaeota archaeon]